jgi:uncharacterized repeat protein (TIGR02059 family)
MVDLKFYNNTSAFNLNYGFAGRYGASTAGDQIFKNNVSYENYSGDYYVEAGMGEVDEYNSWNTPPGVIVNYLDFISIDSTGITAARQADGSLPDNDCYNKFLRLAATSDLIEAGTEVGLDYNDAAPDLGAFEYQSGSFTTPSVPIYLRSIIESASTSRLDMTYNMSLANIVPAASAFTVRVNSSVRSISSVSISGTTVQLTLASPVVYGDVVTVAYTKPATNPLQTTAGGQAASLSAQAVINNCTIPDNQPPIVSLSSPTKSSTYIAPATITIDANASDPDGSISKVEFYQGTVKIGERTSIPYSYTWKDVPEGNYLITAVAIDNSNLKTTSSAVTVVVEKSFNTINLLPVVTIISPKKGTKYKKNDKISIEADATDPDGSITKVEFKSGSAILAELTSKPYVYFWEAADTGTTLITVIATDNLGATSSEHLAIFVDPSVDMNSDNINIYPNPNDGHIKIEIDPEISEKVYAIKIVNLSGKTIYHKEMTSQESSGEIDLSYSPSGTYVLIVTNGYDIRTTKKFIIR